MDILTRQAILDFSHSFHKTFLEDGDKGNYIASPLGLWLLVALQGAGRPNEDLEAFLGVTSRIAYDTALELLKTAPKDLAIATGIWVNGLLEQNIVTGWIKPMDKKLINISRTLPTKEELDAWANKNTKGIIEAFPMEEVSPTLITIIANALAVKIDWDKPFDPLPVERTKLSTWGVENVLHENFIGFEPLKFYQIDDEIYCAYTKGIKTGINVASVISKSPYIRPREVTRVTEGIVAGSFTPLTLEEILLLESEETDVFTIERRMLPNGGKYGSVVLPAWEAKSSFDLKELATDFNKIIAKELTDQIEGVTNIEGRQSAAAKFHKKGFEAAALTYFAGRIGAPPPQVEKKEAILIRVNFVHNFATVAYFNKKQGLVKSSSNWNNLPIFTSWIKKADGTELNH